MTAIRLLLAAAAFALLLGPARSADQVAPSSPLLQSVDKDEEEKAVEPELVVTRGWGHSKFGRIVFDWRDPVTFTAKIVGDQLRITFDRPMKSDLNAAGQRLKPFIGDFKVHPNGTVVSASLNGYFSVRSFANENAVVIDLLPEDKPQGEPDEDPDAWLKRTPKIAVRAGEHPGFGRMVFDWQGDVGYDIERKGPVVKIRFDRPARIDVSRLATALAGRVTAASSETRKSDVTVGMVIPEGFEIRHFRDGHRVAIDVLAPAPPRPETHTPAKADAGDGHKAAPSKKALNDGHDGGKAAEAEAADAKKPLQLAREALRKRREAERTRAENAKKFKDAPLVTVDAERKGPAVEVRFNWRKPVAAAVYRRDDNVYVLFDDTARLAVEGLKVVGEGLIDDAEQTDADRMSLVRLKVPKTLAPSVWQEGTLWTLRLAPAQMTGPIEHPVEVVSNVERDGRSTILLTAKGLGRPHVFLDRLVGDVVNVYPVQRAGTGSRVERNLVDIDLLSSALGLAVVPRRDDLQMIRNAEGLFVSSPSGLSISSASDTAGKTPATEASAYAFGDLVKWTGKSDDFENTKQLHLRRILVAPDAQRNGARLDLVRFYLANGMAADSMGVLEVVLAEKPDLVKDPGVRALRGAAHFLLGHYALAQAEFDNDDFKNDPSVAPWRGAIAAARGDWGKAHSQIRDSRGMVAALPQWLKNRFYAIGAEAALAVGDAENAKPWLEALRSSPLNEVEEDYYQFLYAHAQRLDGKTSVAKNVWRRLVETGNRLIRAKSQFALVNADLETKDATHKSAIEQLEALSFAWRGDALEFDVKRRVGELYAESGDYRTALLRLRQAASHFKDVEGAEAIAEDMRKRFRMLFLDGGADKLDAVRALALYEEFRELTPPGEDGDEMIRKLADRLVKVDLLGEASRLLDHQVRYRLTGLARSRVGARLALIDLLNREPQKAAEALKLSEGEELPEELEVQRRYLRVRALSQSKNVEGALAVLSGDVSHEAELLRLEIFWTNERWEEVARTVRRIIPAQNVGELQPKYADLVLRWAVALTMQNDIEGLVALRERFGEAIAKTSYNEAFKAVAGVDVGVVTDFKTLVEKTGDLRDFRSFMAHYREKVRSQALSTIN